MEVVADKHTRQSYPADVGLSQKLAEALLERGLYTRVALDCICLAPPLMIDDALLDRAVDIIGETIPKVLSSL